MSSPYGVLNRPSKPLEKTVNNQAPGSEAITTYREPFHTTQSQDLRALRTISNMSNSFGYSRGRAPFSPPPGYYYDDYLVDSGHEFFNGRRPFGLPHAEFEPRPRPRRIDGRRLIDESARSPRQPGPRDMDELGGSRTDVAGARVAEETKNSLSFGKAMKTLHRRLDLAQTLYTNFQQEYDDDVKKLRGYVKGEALVDVWVKKVASKQSDEDQYQNSNGDPRKYQEKFAEQKTKVAQDLEQAVRTTIKENGTSRKSATRVEASKRLRQKVETSRRQILQLLISVTEAPEHCTALLEELKYLADLIDPENEKNAGLYSSSPDEERDEAGEEDEE